MDVFLHKLYQKDDELFECFSKVAKELVSEYKNSNYSQSITSLMGLMRTINSLKLAAFDLAEESETHLYAIKTLLRPAIEHFLRFSYLQAQLVKNTYLNWALGTLGAPCQDTCLNNLKPRPLR